MRSTHALALAAIALTGSSFADEVVASGASFQVRFVSPAPEPLQQLARHWVETSAKVIGGYYGSFPIKRAVIQITPRDGKTPEGGQAFDWNGPLIKVALGRDTTAAQLADDWVLPHEMQHLCFPSLAESHHWLEEGLATYVEPVGRARAGILTPERVWADFVHDMPQGQPEAGDRGLDRTHTWGRTYWGGALFSLRADVEIRRRTKNRFGLEHALRAIAGAGGVITTNWSIDQVIAAGDKATGVGVLRELYDAMKEQPVKVDLEALWKELGVARHGKSVTFDDSAPLADVRKAITGQH